MPDTESTTGSRDRGGTYAALVATGIAASRLVGFVRMRVFAHYFSTSYVADAFDAALRIPNLLQNLFGEGVLSASFIPVYANLLARGEKDAARRVAGAVLALLALVVSVLVLLGILATPLLVSLIAPGFEDERRLLAIPIVRILFPGVGLLVISAWCLGILNSHRKFLLSYLSPVAWNLALIATMVILGRRVDLPRLALYLAWGSVAGSLLQVLVQWPTVVRVTRGIRPNLRFRSEGVSTVVRNFVPVFVGRGVVQVSAYVDGIIASLLPIGVVATLNYAQALYMLPVSLFGMSVSAAELPVMSGTLGSAEEIHAALRERLDRGLRRIAFFVVPSVVGFLAFGDVIAATIYQTGRFTRADAVWVWAVLAGATVGLLATTQARLYASTFYALKDTRTPLRCALIRVTVAAALALALSLRAPGMLGIDPKWGAAGITLGSGMAGWVELALLQRLLGRRIGRTALPLRFLATLWGCGLASAAVAWLVRWPLAHLHPVLLGVLVLGTFGVAWFGLAFALRIPQVAPIAARLRRVVGR